MPIVPAKVASDSLTSNRPSNPALEATTFASLGLKEYHVEQFVRDHPGLLFYDEEDSVLIVGEQVRNTLGDAADLVGIRANGNFVVVEVKRDARDIGARTEPPEWQAIRYASTIATIERRDQLINEIYLDYLQGRPEGSNLSDDELMELADKTLDDFLEDPESDTFNQEQEIILVASAFDQRTLAACAWLIKNDVPLKCVRLTPHRYSESEIMIEVQTVLPVPELEDSFIELAGGGLVEVQPTRTWKSRGAQLPDLFEAKLIVPGDEIYVKKAPEKRAKWIDPYTVEFEGKKMSPNQFGQLVTGWPSFSVYQSGFLARTDERIQAVRDQYRRPAPESPT